MKPEQKLDQNQINKLLSLEEPEWGKEWINYSQHNFKKEDANSLIDIAVNDNLFWGNCDEDEEKSLWHTNVHARRILAQLKISDAIIPLINSFEDFEESDWAMEELPVILGMIGKDAIKPLKDYLSDITKCESVKITAASSLEKIVENNPENFDEVVEIFTSYLELHDKKNQSLNALMVSFLHDLQKIKQEIPPRTISAIRDIYNKDLADLDVMGDLEDVEMSLGLRKKRETPKKRSKRFERLQNILTGSLPRTSQKIGRNDPCHCNSGKKYKKCCLPKEE